MSTYQELKGLKVKYLSTDTSGDRIKEGELFYNSTSGNLKSFVATQSWISTPSMGTGRNILGRAGTATAALAIGGYLYPNSPEVTANAETYDGTIWAEV